VIVELCRHREPPFFGASAFRAAGIVAVSVPLANAAVAAMNDQLDSLAADDGAAAGVGVRLGRMARTRPQGALAPDNPLAAARDDVNRPAPSPAGAIT